MYQQSLFEEQPPQRPAYVPRPEPDHSKAVEHYTILGGAFARNQLGIVKLDLGDGQTRRFRFIYTPKHYAVQRWSGPCVEIFGGFGYENLEAKMVDPVHGTAFDEWIRELLERVKVSTAVRFSSRDRAIREQSAQRLGMTPKQLAKLSQGDDAARMSPRKQDTTPVEIVEVSYEPTHWRSHYEIFGEDDEVYWGRFPEGEVQRKING